MTHIVALKDSLHDIVILRPALLLIASIGAQRYSFHIFHFLFILLHTRASALKAPPRDYFRAPASAAIASPRIGLAAQSAVGPPSRIFILDSALARYAASEAEYDGAPMLMQEIIDF